MKFKRFLLIVVSVSFGLPPCLLAQTFEVARIDGRPSGHRQSTRGSDPIIDYLTFGDIGVTNSERNNINGPSLIRLPEWLEVKDKIHPDANYYLYFGNHVGRSIRLAWASSLTGDWTLFNIGTAPDRAWGEAGNNTGEQTEGAGVLDLSTVLSFGNVGLGLSGHLASPDVYIDDVNQRFVMYFHGPRNGFGPPGQQTYVATSSNGLNFNDAAEYGQVGHGPRDVLPTGGYFRSFRVGSATFAFSNMGELWRAPLLNLAGDPNTLENADSEGGFWTPLRTHNHGSTNWWDLVPSNENPIHNIYGSKPLDPRHFATYTRDHLDPNDENVYVFYSSRNDSPESIFLTVLDTNGRSVEPANWSAVGQRIILEPLLPWEGSDQPLGVSQNGAETNVRQVRDPAIFEDTMGTAETADDKLYILYTGEGEEAIGLAELSFRDDLSNTAEPQGDLELSAGFVEAVRIDYDGNGGPTQPEYLGVGTTGDGNGLFEPEAIFDNPFGDGEVRVTFQANRWKERSVIASGNAFASQNNLLQDFGGPVSGDLAVLTLNLPSGTYEVILFQHESGRSAAETSILTISDANGRSTPLGISSSFGNNPAFVQSTSHEVDSNGNDPVLFTIDNNDVATTGAYPLNGLEIRPLLSLDSDGDGMPDDWEDSNGLNSLDASDKDLDADGDNFSNYEEWVALTDPTDSDSNFSASSIFSGSNLTFSFFGSDERLYTVQKSLDLGKTEEWLSIVEPRVGEGSSDSFVIPIVLENKKSEFYRVAIFLP